MPVSHRGEQAGRKCTVLVWTYLYWNGDSERYGRQYHRFTVLVMSVRPADPLPWASVTGTLGYEGTDKEEQGNRNVRHPADNKQRRIPMYYRNSPS